MNKFDVIISGGGLSGLITAIALKGMGFGGSILATEQREYPFKINNSFVITHVARLLLHNLLLYRKHNYCEGRYIVYRLVNREHNISFTLPDTAITSYSGFLYVLYEIALNNGINIMQNTKILDYNFDSKYVITVNGEIYFENLVIAEGMTKAYPGVKFAEEDAEEFDFHIDDVPCEREIIRNKNIIYVGDKGGFRDFLTDINCTYSLISAILAAENIYSGKSVIDYYESIKYLTREIEASKILKNNMSDFSFLKNVLMGSRSCLSYL